MSQLSPDSKSAQLYLEDTNLASPKIDNLAPFTGATRVYIKDAVGADSDVEQEIVSLRNAIKSINSLATFYQGVVNSPADLPSTNYESGWIYYVGTSGIYAGQDCEAGDFLICISDFSGSFQNSDWRVLQANIVGAVTGPGTASIGHVAFFADAKGLSVEDRGFTIETSVPPNAVFTDTTYDAATSVPLAPSSAGSVGTSLKYAREDHEHPEQINISGNAATATNAVNATNATNANHASTADTATNAVTANQATIADKLSSSAQITVQVGSTSGSTSFDGSSDVTISVPSPIGVDITGAAASATTDSSGNVFESTYLTESSNATFSGNISFVNEVNFADNIVVNGAVISSTSDDIEEWSLHNRKAPTRQASREITSPIWNTTGCWVANSADRTYNWYISKQFKVSGVTVGIIPIRVEYSIDTEEVSVYVNKLVYDESLGYYRKDVKLATIDYVNELVEDIPGIKDALDALNSALSDSSNTAASLATQLAAKADDSSVVHKTGDELVDGSKTFSNAHSSASLSDTDKSDALATTEWVQEFPGRLKATVSSADHAITADTATNADHASEAGHASTADNATTADSATIANSAAFATTANSATFDADGNKLSDYASSISALQSSIESLEQGGSADLSNYVTTNTVQTISAVKNVSAYLNFFTASEKGTIPTDNVWLPTWSWIDSTVANVNAHKYANIWGVLRPTGNVEFGLKCFYNIAGNTDSAGLVLVTTPSTCYATAPTHSDYANSSDAIATTKWVRNATGNTNLNAATASKATADAAGNVFTDHYATSDALSAITTRVETIENTGVSVDTTNLVTTNTTQTITGTKTFTGPVNFNPGFSSFVTMGNFIKGSKPETSQTWEYRLIYDSTSPADRATRLGLYRGMVDANGNSRSGFFVYKNEAGSTLDASLEVIYPFTGSPYATGPSYLSDLTISNNYLMTAAMFRQLTGNIAANAATANRATADASGNVFTSHYATSSALTALEQRVETVETNGGTIDTTKLVTTNTVQTITGSKTFTSTMTINRSNPVILCSTTALSKGEHPSSVVSPLLLIAGDKENVTASTNRLGGLLCQVTTSGSPLTCLLAYKNIESSTAYDSLGIIYDVVNDYYYGYAPTIPDNTSSSTKIATTAWVRNATGNTNLNAATADRATADASGNVFSNKYVTLDSAQTISGRKSFTDRLYIAGAAPDISMVSTNYNFDGDPPASNTFSSIKFYGADKSKTIGEYKFVARANGSHELIFNVAARNREGAAFVSLVYPATGDPYFNGITYSNYADSSTKIATTAFVHNVIKYGTIDYTAGTTALPTGCIYLQYEA